MQPVLRETAATALAKGAFIRLVRVLSVYGRRDLRIGKFTTISCGVLVGNLTVWWQVRELLLVGSQGLKRLRGQAAPRVYVKRLHFLDATTLPL